MNDTDAVKTLKFFVTTARTVNTDNKLKEYRALCDNANYPCTWIITHDLSVELLMDLKNTPYYLSHRYLEDLALQIPPSARVVKSVNWKKLLRVVGLSMEEASALAYRLMARF